MGVRGAWRKVAVVLAVLAAFVLVTSFGDPLPAVPFASISLTAPSAASSNWQTTAVAINQARQVVLIDTDGQLAALIDCDTFESPFDVVTDVCVSSDYVYVSGVRHVAGSDEIELERVAKYDADGEFLSVAYERKGTGTIPAIWAIDDLGDDVAVITSSTEGEGDSERVVVLAAHDGNPQELAAQELAVAAVTDASYSVALGRVATLSFRGVIDDTLADNIKLPDGKTFSAITAMGNGKILATDSVSGTLCVIDDDGSVDSVDYGLPFDKVDMTGNVVTALVRDQNSVLVIDLDRDNDETRLYASVRPSALVSARVLLIWLSAAYLVALLLVLAVRAVLRLLAQNRAGELVAPFASLAVVLTVAITLGNSSLYTYNAQVKTRTNEVNACADYLASTLQPYAGELTAHLSRTLLSGVGDNQVEIDARLMDTAQSLSEMVNAAARRDIGLYYVVYGADDNGLYCVLDSTGEFVWGESVSGTSSESAVAQAFGSAKPSNDAQLGTSRYESTLYRLVRIADPTGQGQGMVIEIGSRMRSFEAVTAQSLFRNALGLLVMLLVVYMGYAELRACGRCVVRYRRMQREGERGAISAIARPFALTSMMLAGVDGVMSTLIAKDLLTAAGWDVTTSSEAKLLVMLPAVMVGLGQALGQGIYGRAGSRQGLRQIMARWSVVMVVCSLATAVVVSAGSFWGYCAAKLVLSVPFGLLYTAAYSLRRHATTSEQRELAKAGVKRSNTSSAALGTALGGYAALALGNAGVYVALALVSIALLAMTVVLIPADTRPPERMRDFSREERVRMRKFLLGPRPLVIALAIILPSVIATGYASSLFPLFSAEMGLEKADINNLYLIGQLVVYVSISAIERFSKHVGNWSAGFYAIAGLGVVFMAFSFNTTVVWSAVVIALVGLLVKTANAWKPLWMGEAEASAMPLGWATGAMFVARSFARIAKPFILGGLLVSGGQEVVLYIGAFCILCAAAIRTVCRGEGRAA